MIDSGQVSGSNSRRATLSNPMSSHAAQHNPSVNWQGACVTIIKDLLHHYRHGHEELVLIIILCHAHPKLIISVICAKEIGDSWESTTGDVFTTHTFSPGLPIMLSTQHKLKNGGMHDLR